MALSDYEYRYLDHLRELLTNGEEKGDRTGTGTRSIFGHQMRVDMREGFPLLTTKKLHLKSIIHELLWFLNGDTNIKYLNDNGVRIWDEWANNEGELGPIYGHQWRRWPSFDIFEDYHYGSEEPVKCQATENHWAADIDQISKVIEILKSNPDCRRMIVSAWNVGQIEDMALAPCHTMFQFYTNKMTKAQRHSWLHKTGKFDSIKSESGAEMNYNHDYMDNVGVPSRYIDVQLYQRSADWFLGVPFNVASYSLLLMMAAQQVNMVPRYFIHSFGDTHLYSNHLEQAKEQLGRSGFELPTMLINKADDIFSYQYEDFALEGYESQPAIKAPVAV